MIKVYQLDVLLASQAIGKSKIYNLLEFEDVISALATIKKLELNLKKLKIVMKYMTWNKWI